MSLLVERHNDSPPSRVAIMTARKALQEVHLQRWLTRYRLLVVSHRARGWLKRRPDALLPFRGGRDVRARVESSPHALRLKVVKREVKREIKREPRIVD